MVPEQFTSYGSVYVSNKAPQVITSYTDNNTANLYDLTTSNMLVDTYKAILSTNNFFENVKKNVDIPYNVDTLKTMVRYDSIEETGIIQVYATAFSPEEAQKLCAAVLEYANYTIMDIVEAGSVKTNDDATLPKGHSYPNVTRNTLLGMILGGFLACAIILLIRWEITYKFYPQRFSETTNCSLSCANCEEKLCHHKRQLKSFLNKNKEYLYLKGNPIIEKYRKNKD